MKLNEMSTKQMCGVLAKIAGPMARIAQDDKLNVMFEKFAKMLKSGELKKASTAKKGAMLLETVVPVLLDTHYDDTIEILSVMTGKAAEEIDNQPFAVTIEDVKACMDDQLIGFFMQSVASAQEK